MFLGEALDFSVKALKANPVHSFLTGLGMVIGTASVILVVTISLTSRDYILEQIEGVGSNMIFAYYEAGNQSATQADADFVKMADVDAINQSGLALAIPILEKYTARGFSVPSTDLIPITPAVCAIASIINTPGITGANGKCP